MENASKALIMAASVLIGVVIISLAVYLFTSFSTSAKEMEKQMEEGQLEQCNNQFTSYVGREDLTIYDVITVTNLAKENNKYYELSDSSENNFYITVKLGYIQLQEKSEDELSGLLNSTEQMTEITDNIRGTVKQLKRYDCRVSLSKKTGRVKEVEFKEIKPDNT